MAVVPFRRPPFAACLPFLIVAGACATRSVSAPPASPVAATLGNKTEPKAAPPPEPVYYHLWVESSGVAAQITLNGIPVETVEDSNLAAIAIPINRWMRPGKNRLHVTGSIDKRRNPYQSWLTAHLVRQTRDDGLEEKVVAEVEFQPTERAEWMEKVETFVVDRSPPTQLWAETKPVTLDEPTRAAVALLAHELQTALAKKDVERAAALLDFKVVDIARSLYKSPDEARLEHRQHLESILKDAAFRLDAFNPEDFTLEVLGDGRLVRISRHASPAVQARLSQGGRFVLSVYAAQIDGVWRIVR